MPDATELSATLRRLLAGQRGEWEADAEHGQIISGAPAIDGIDERDVYFSVVAHGVVEPDLSLIVWLLNNAEAIATALERGAAAERVVAASNHRGWSPGASASEMVAADDAYEAAAAAYAEFGGGR
jgi:hypothetical protein